MCKRTLEVCYAPVPPLERYLSRLERDTEVISQQIREFFMILAVESAWSKSRECKPLYLSHESVEFLLAVISHTDAQLEVTRHSDPLSPFNVC